MDLLDRILELSRRGYYCAGILGQLFCETIGLEDENVVKVMSGLDGGIGHSQGTCGCMTACCCILGYFGEDAKPLMGEFISWFKEEMMVYYGGFECNDIIKGNPAKRVEICPQIIADSYMKCMELLQDKGLI